MNAYIDYENNAKTWWEAARADIKKRKDNKSSIVRFFTSIEKNDCAQLPLNSDAQAIIAWCESLPGWSDGPKYAKTALIFEG